MKEFRYSVALLSAQSKAVTFQEERKEAGGDAAFQWDRLGGGAREAESGCKLSPDVPWKGEDFIHKGETEWAHVPTGSWMSHLLAAGNAQSWRTPNYNQQLWAFQCCPSRSGTVVPSGYGWIQCYLCNHAHP